MINLDPSTAKTDFSKANLFNQYFHSVFHNSSPHPNIEKMPHIPVLLSTISISIEEVHKALVSLDAQR